jgi:hypothetical protein
MIVESYATEAVTFLIGIGAGITIRAKLLNAQIFYYI